MMNPHLQHRGTELGATSTVPCSCPRCGYDLSGTVAAWKTQSPLRLTCPECGLDATCRDLLNPAFARLPRFLEHASRERLAALLVTAWRAVRPRRFWTWVRMEHRLRPAAMLAAVAACMALWYAAAVLTGVGLLLGVMYAIVVAGRGVPSYGSWFEYVLPLAWPLSVTDYGTWFYLGFEGIGVVAPFAAVGLLAAALMPLSYGLLPQTLRAARVRPGHLLRIGAFSWVGLVPIFVGWACAWMLAGTVDWLVYQTPLWTVLAFVLQHRAPLTLATVLLWVCFWWTAATRHYLRLPRARGVALAMVVLCALAALLVLLLLDPNALVEDLGIA